MFKQATLKLTAYYLAIIMVISLIFSVALYNVSTREVTYGLRTPTITNQLFGDNNPFQSFDQLRNQRVEESRDRILNDLVIFNLIIFFGGWAVSYFLARKTLEPIEQAHEQQVRFASDASHELRTPLAAMRSEIEVALRAKTLSAAESKEVLTSNLEEITKLTNLSDSLLKLSRYERELPEKEVTNFSAEQTINATIKSVRSISEPKNITITASIHALQLYGNETMITELITILLDNAIKYSQEKTKVLVSVKNAEQCTEIKVSDEGPGIHEAELSKVFDRFYRADTSRTGSGGFGLGLAIAAEIVRLHRGKIELVNNPDRGLTVIVSLPASKNA